MGLLEVFYINVTAFLLIGKGYADYNTCYL